MKKKRWSILGLALGVLVLGMLVGLLTVGSVAADPTPGIRFQIPRIDIGDVLGTGPWETWIHVQNVSMPDPVTGIEPATGAIFVGWGEYSEICPTNDPGIIAHYCQLIQGNAIWTLRSQLDEAVRSGILYSVDPAVFQEACQASEEAEGDTEAWRCWEEEWRFGTCEGKGGGWNDGPGDAFGEEVAVTVTRYGPNSYGTFGSSTYTGISEEMDGEGPPWEYYAPYVMKGYNGLDTEITIQNSGDLCTSVWIDYMEQGSCDIVYKHHIEQLAPGEAVRLRVPCDVDQIPCGWLGSAHIAAEQPLGIIVDETSFDEPCMGVDRGTLLTHRARPKVELRDGEPIEDTKVYADLIFREWSGWDASIQVQNLSRVGQYTFVTVDFMDNGGDEILFLADWVCPGGSSTFYLPIVTDLLPGYVGAAEIESHGQIDYPGGETPAAPIFAVVDLKKPDDPLTPEMDAQGGSYNAHPYSQKEWVSEIALPFMAKDAYGTHPWTSMIAIRNNSNCNKIRPEIHFKDETGTVVCTIPSFWMRPKQVKVFDLNNIGCLYPGYVGAAKVYVNEFEQLCDVDRDGHVDNEPLMPSVIVVDRGILGLPYGGGGNVSALADTWGDVTNVYEGVPYATNIPACYGDIFGTVSFYDYEQTDDDPEAHEPLAGATVTADTGETDTTSYAGGYELMRLEGNALRSVTAEKFGYYPWTEEVNLDCGADTNQDILLVCQGILYGTVEDAATGTAVEGAEVTLDVESLNLGRTWIISATTDANGLWWMKVPLVGDDGGVGVGPFAFAPWTLTIRMEGEDYDDWVDGYVDVNDNGIVDVGDENIAFADEHGWNADDCVGSDSEGCTSGEDFCDAPNNVFDDNVYTGSVSGLIHHAFIQGKVYCDGLVNNNNAFDPGEEQPNTLVKLYEDTDGDTNGDVFLEQMLTLSDGSYQFKVSLDTDGDGVIDRDDYTVTAGTIEEAATNMTAGETRVVPIDICP